MNECPCYELVDGCGCACCVPMTVHYTNNDQIPQCVSPDETFCECWSNERIMQHQGIDPIAARNSGGSYSRNTLIKSMELK